MAWAPSPYALRRMTQANGTVSDAPTTNMRLTWRTSAVSSASGPTMNPGVSHSESTGSPNASHSCRKRAALSALAGVDGAGQVHRVVGDDADRPALHPGQRRHHARGERRPQLEDRPLVGQQLERPPDVVDPAPVGRHDVAQLRPGPAPSSRARPPGSRTGSGGPPRRLPSRRRRGHRRPRSAPAPTPARPPRGGTRRARRPRSWPGHPCRCWRREWR